MIGKFVCLLILFVPVNLRQNLKPEEHELTHARTLCSLEAQRSQSKVKATKLLSEWFSSAISAPLREARFCSGYSFIRVCL